MKSYIVHVETTHHEEKTPVDAEHVQFIPDAFSKTAFFFGPFWMARHGLWLWLLVWSIAVILCITLFIFIALPLMILLGVIGLVQLCLGFEGNQLRLSRLFRKGWRPVDIVTAPKQAQAEPRFFYRWTSSHAESFPPSREEDDTEGKSSSAQ